MALLTLFDPVKFSATLRQVCLPANPGTSNYEPFAGWEAVATGWGSTVDRGSRFPDTLMEVPVTVMADQDCRRRFGQDRIQE